jgi:hypothetical protein
LREHRLSLDRLTSVTRRSLAPKQPPVRSREDGMGSAAPDGTPGFGPATQHALARHWRDRNLQWDGAGTEDASLIAPPAAPPTRRAQRKLAALPQAGYSVRGLHALLSSMLERYRKTCDPEFGARSPRDLLA